MDKIKLDGNNFASLKYNLAEVILSQAFTNPKLNYKVENSNIVFHYTSLEKFISIVESQSFYFTNLNYLNDSEEYHYGVKIVTEVIKNYSINEINSTKKKILDAVIKNIQHIYKSPRYIACFSKNGDLLSQWRAYANDGKGIAIGFKTEKLGEFKALNISQMNIEYNENIQKNVISEIIAISLNYFEETKILFDWNSYDYEYIIAIAIIETLEAFIPTYKHPTFSEEKEFRIECCIDGNMNKTKDHKIIYRATENLIVPFLKIPYTNPIHNNKKYNEQISQKKLPIEKIIIGPSLNFELNYEAIKNLLLNHGYKDVEIVQSKIPYRL